MENSIGCKSSRSESLLKMPNRHYPYIKLLSHLNRQTFLLLVEEDANKFVPLSSYIINKKIIFMLKTFTLLLLLSYTLTTAAQENIKETIFEVPAPNQVVTVMTSIQNQPMNDVGALKDELLTYDEKVVDVSIDLKAKLLHVAYNEHMLLDDLRQAFERHNIPYLVAQQSAASSSSQSEKK